MAAHDTLVSDVMDEMDPRLLEFIKAHVVTFTRWEIMRFLYENQETQDSLENLARYIGRAPDLVRSEADQMVAAQILTPTQRGDAQVYALTEDRQIRSVIAALVAAARERAFRMKLVYHILRAGDHT